MQLLCRRPVGRTRRDQVDHLELGVGEAVPARFCPRLADDATLHTEPAQLAAHPARIGERFVAHVGVEGGIELMHRLIRVIGAREFTAGVLGSCGVQKRPRRGVKQLRGRQQRLGIMFEYPAGTPGDPGE